MDNLIWDILNRIASEASRFRQSRNQVTIQKDDIIAAVNAVLSGELLDQANLYGTNSVKKYKKKSKASSYSAKADLIFPVSRISQLLRDGRYAGRVMVEASVYLAAVLEYLASGILELAGECADENIEPIINSQHLQSVIREEDGLKILFPRFNPDDYI